MQMFLLLSFIPSTMSIYCMAYDEGGSTGSFTTCSGDACGTAFSFGRIFSRGCITNVNVSTGCWNESHLSKICYCKTDLCNWEKGSNDSIQTLQPANCHDTNNPAQCDSTRCLWSTDQEMDNCRRFGDPKTLHEVFTNIIMIDTTSKIDQNGSTIQSRNMIANCDSLQCSTLAEKLFTQNFTSSRPQIRCFSNQTRFDKRENETFPHSCSGDYCYMSRLGEYGMSRGCLTVVDDSLAVRKVEAGKYGFLSLNFYICSADYCNLEDIPRVTIHNSAKSFQDLLDAIEAAKNDVRTSNFFVISALIVARCIFN